jgi:hypothetical protein
MPITPFNSGNTFQPETLHNMSTAFEAACNSRRDPATEMVAKLIVKLAQSGVTDVDTLFLKDHRPAAPDRGRCICGPSYGRRQLDGQWQQPSSPADEVPGS